MTEVTAVLAGNGILLALLSYLGIEIRRDVRYTRDKVLILWEWYSTQLERRRADGEPEGT